MVTIRTQFVTTHNNIGFARKKAQTISFIERGFEKLGLDHQMVVFLWCSYIIKSCSLQESFSWRWAGRLWFLAIFPQPFLRITCPFFYISLCSLSFVHVQDRLSRTDICPISPYPKWLGVAVKTEEHGSVRCRVLNGSKGSFPFVLGRYTIQRLLLY